MKVTVKRMDHVHICIPPGSEDEARRFYEGILGFLEIEKPDSLKPRGGLWYNLGTVKLHIGVEEMADYKSKRHPAFEVEKLAEVRRYLEQQGVATYDEEPIPGVNRFKFTDPFGNHIEFLERFQPEERKQ